MIAGGSRRTIAQIKTRNKYSTRRLNSRRLWSIWLRMMPKVIKIWLNNRALLQANRPFLPANKVQMQALCNNLQLNTQLIRASVM